MSCRYLSALMYSLPTNSEASAITSSGIPILRAISTAKRTARIADLRLEQGLHVLAVVEHGSVHYALMVLGKVFQVLVMCRDDAEGLFLVEPFQDGFGYGAADLRFRAASEFVDEQKTGATASFHHVFHVEQMAGIGAQVVLYALFVPDVDEDATENAGA